MMDANALQTFANLMRQATILELGPENKVAIIPSGTLIQDLEKFLPPPDRIQQAATLLTVPAFLAYIERYAIEPTTIFADETSGRYEVVFDYHLAPGADNQRGNSDHTAVYACPKSEQWLAWTKHSGTWFEQTQFAAFLETNLREIHSPPGAAFLQVALELKIHKSAEFESEVRLDNGQTRFRYSETIRGNTKAGDIEIPDSFTLRLPVFVDGAIHTVEARFRYRMNEGKLSLGYELVRPVEVWNQAVKVVTAEISKGAPDVHLYAGVRG